jgi:hypothetical protein
LYRFDVFGVFRSGDFRLVEILLARLSYEPKSLWRAKLLTELPDDGSEVGDPDPVVAWFGWGRVEQMVADVYDQLSLNTDVTLKHGTKMRPKVYSPYPRPDVRRKAVSFDAIEQFFAGIS